MLAVELCVEMFLAIIKFLYVEREGGSDLQRYTLMTDWPKKEHIFIVFKFYFVKKGYFAFSYQIRGKKTQSEQHYLRNEISAFSQP